MTVHHRHQRAITTNNQPVGRCNKYLGQPLAVAGWQTTQTWTNIVIQPEHIPAVPLTLIEYLHKILTALTLELNPTLNANEYNQSSNVTGASTLCHNLSSKVTCTSVILLLLCYDVMC